MTRTSMRALGPTAGLITALAVGLTACGGSGSTPAVSSSATASATRPVAAVGSTVTGKDLATRLKAAIAAAPGAAVATTMKSGEDIISAKGSTTVTAVGSGLALDVEGGDSPDDSLSLVQVPGTLYVNLSSQSESLGDGKDWVKITDVSKGGIFASFLGMIGVTVSGFSSPDTLLRLTTVLPTLTVRSSDAKGVTYTAPVTSTQSVQLFPVELFGGDEAARAEVAKASAGDDGTLTLMVDTQGRPSSFTYTTVAEGDAIEIATTYSGWGPSTAIKEPPAASTVDAAELDADTDAAMGAS